MEYKELDRPYIAKQFNGNIITAFIKAVYNFFHKDTDEHCAYFKHLSIDTADTEHLIFIGKLMGIQLFTVFTDPSGNKYLTFSLEDSEAEVEYGYNNGFSEEYKQYSSEVKGVFATGEEEDLPVDIPVGNLRSLLRALSLTDMYSADSMFIIDTIINIFTDSTAYTISYSEDYPGVVNVLFDASVTLRTLDILQKTLDIVLEGGTTVVLSRSDENE